jgi:hypothetical protein
MAIRIQRQHGMQQQATPDAFADLAQPSAPLSRRAKIDLARILDRQHMPAGRRKGGLFSPACKQGGQCHLPVGQKVNHKARPGRNTISPVSDYVASDLCIN